MMEKQLDFAKLNFFNNYVMCYINEGEIIHLEKTKKLIREIVNHFKEKSFVYVSHRIHSYSVDPEVYVETSKTKTLAGFVVISNNDRSIKNALFEKLFLNKPFHIFKTIEEAVPWINKVCGNHTETQKL